MGASEAVTDPSSLYQTDYMADDSVSDTEMMHIVRNALASVQAVSFCFFPCANFFFIWFLIVVYSFVLLC